MAAAGTDHVDMLRSPHDTTLVHPLLYPNILRFDESLWKGDVGMAWAYGDVATSVPRDRCRLSTGPFRWWQAGRDSALAHLAAHDSGMVAMFTIPQAQLCCPQARLTSPVVANLRPQTVPIETDGIALCLTGLTQMRIMLEREGNDMRPKHGPCPT